MCDDIPKNVFELAPGELRIVCRRDDGATTFELQGELEFASVPDLERELEHAHADGAGRVVLDLRGVTFIDSTGIRTLLEFVQRSRAARQRAALVRPNGLVLRTLKISGVDRMLPFVDEPSQ